MEKKKKSFNKIATPVIALTAALWLTLMGALTIATATDMVSQVEYDLSYELASNHGLNIVRYYDLPGAREASMIETMNWDTDLRTVGWINSVFRHILPLDIWAADAQQAGFCCPTVIYKDQYGDPILPYGDYLTFLYTDPENWSRGNTEPLGYGYVDWNSVSWELYPIDAHYTNNVFRLTGTFDGAKFTPSIVEVGSREPEFWYESQWASAAALEQVNKFDLDGELNWVTLLDTSAQEPDQTTIYIWDTRGAWTVDYSPATFSRLPVTVDGHTYDSLTDFAASQRGSYSGYWERKNNLIQSVVVESIRVEGSYGTYIHEAVAVCYPLQFALWSLRWVYAVSAALLALVVWRILRSVKLNLTEPLEMLENAMAQGKSMTLRSAWAEPFAMQEYYAKARQTILDQQTENTRLNTALEYAKDAEENRKQLVSNITHELKTPLAVIRTYTEGLQTDIPDDKKEHYIQVILDETDRMDGMVLQMLDLSRLESGRVKLKAEEFSLSDLIRYVAQKFEPLMAEKELSLQLELDGDVRPNADEARIEQVITNFMSNAVKYSPVGGAIQVRAYSHWRGTFFYITNTANHLSEEGLQKVFDSFYREDAARTEKSTGLGLAIVKQIVTLHRGQCFVENTSIAGQPAVEFGFSIPG
jgi:signal transduction histidine kinase